MDNADPALVWKSLRDEVLWVCAELGLARIGSDILGAEQVIRPT